MVDKRRAERIIYGIDTVLTVVAVSLTLTALLLPYWFPMEFDDPNGAGKIEVDVGLYQDRVCWNGECENHWRDDDDYNSAVSMPDEEKIRGFETAGVAMGFLALLALCPLWVCHIRHSGDTYRKGTFIMFYVFSMLAGFLCVVGVLIMAAKVDDDIDWAPFLSVIGGVLFFVSAINGCVLCRYDPSYGTLENPVSPDHYRSLTVD